VTCARSKEIKDTKKSPIVILKLHKLAVVF